MKVHIFKNDHVYTIALLTFLQRNFDLKNHLFIFQCYPSEKNIPIDSERIFYMPGFRNLLKIKQLIGKSEQAFFHLLPMGPVIFFWCFYRKIFQKTVWIYWGADVYAGANRYKSLKHFIYHLCRWRIIRKIPHIAGFIKGDFDLLKKIYRTNATYHHVVYPLPTNFSLIDRLREKKTTGNNHGVTIMVGNSGSESNHHREALRLLGKYRNNNIRIVCPLSYGGKNKSYPKKVIKEGYSIFGSNFIPLTDFLKPEDYTKLLLDVNIAVMNHDRQQGLGNSISLLYMGKKVYLRPETTSFKYFKENGVLVFGINDIHHSSFDDFIRFHENDGRINCGILKKEFSEENYSRKWKHILEL